MIDGTSEWSRGRRPRVWGNLCAVWLAGILLVSCQTGPIEVTPNPPDFRRLSRDDIRSAMGTLATEVRELERVLDSPDEHDHASRRGLVLASLDRMRAAAESLEQPGRTSQHPMIDERLEAFSERIRAARRDVERDPPRYFRAGTVAGACFLCHGNTLAAGVSREPPPRSRTRENSSIVDLEMKVGSSGVEGLVYQ